MSVHTGIDFPVSYGTPVMAATDGTVRTQWNSAYGNMAIVTATDGTETWYCHLSSTKIRSGTRSRPATPIAYSGNSGNSTGPHLHFEVRPGGGSAIDPLPWLRSHGLDPRVTGARAGRPARASTADAHATGPRRPPAASLQLLHRRVPQQQPLRLARRRSRSSPPRSPPVPVDRRRPCRARTGRA